MGGRGQTLVEFALTLPLLLFVLLGFAEVAFLVGTRSGYQNAADVLADVASYRMSVDPGESWRAHWQTIADQELLRAGCHDADVILPDVSHAPGDRVRVRLSCTYQPHVARVFDGLGVTVEAESVVPNGPPIVEPSPSSS